MDIKELNEKRLLKKMSYEDIAVFYQEIECRLLIMQLNTDL